MADAADAEKAEKLAAAKKRFEELKKEKAKGKKADADKDKGKKSDLKKKKAGSKAEKQEVASADRPEGPPDEEEEELGASREADGASESSREPPAGEGDEAAASKDVASGAKASPKQRHARQPSLSVQSRMRSESFRKGSDASPRSPNTTSKGQPLPALAPDGDSINEIYRKQTSRLDELEKENRQLSKDLEVAQGRQSKTDTELEELRENASQIAELKSRSEKAATMEEEISKLKAENASLQRQNGQLQSSAQRSSRKDTASPAGAMPSSPAPADLMAQLDSKTATIESMEQELSNLRAQLGAAASGTSGHTEQVAALEARAERAERAAGAAQRELADARRGLERASERAVREGTERTSAATQLATLQRERDAAIAAQTEAERRAETLQGKLAALTTLHKDTDARRQAGAKALANSQRALETATAEATRLRQARARGAGAADGAGATDDDGLDELEDEARAALAARVRELEAEVHALRRGAWQERRRQLSADGDDSGAALSSPQSATAGGGFDEVDLVGGGARRPSARDHRRTSSFRTVLTSGLKAFAGEGDRAGGGADNDGLLDSGAEDDDDLAFDEAAFRHAQEAEALRRVERVREIKRGLTAHAGFRIDLVELRQSGGGGLGEIFEV